ncbi:MAG: PPA1309 family protein [Aeromicrobium sp.]|uniref:PPA1309 family protein n=1 Tax=Aeromicrobium sp. TaxID=1871063 RepID=UPI0039E640AF
MSDGEETPVLELRPDSPLRRAALEVEAHVAAEGWDQPPRLFALVRTADLVASQPGLAEQLGDGSDGSFTPVEQDGVPVDPGFEEALTRLSWPDSVHGCAVALERVMLPPSAQEDLPADPALVAEAAAAHPDREDVRLVAAVLRGGKAHTTVRRRAAGEGSDDSDLLEGPDLVPELVALLDQTLTETT